MNMDQKILYRLEKVLFSLGTSFALNIPFLEIERGKPLGITGPNGSGKSTLLHLLGFLIRPNAGSLHCSIPHDSRRSAVTLMLQDHYLLRRSVYGNVAYGLRVRGGGKDVPVRARRALESLGLDPDIFSRRQWNELSGGEARRVSLAARLVLEPEILLLDEPVANIDRESTSLITEAIRKIQLENHTTVIITSHDRVWLGAVTDNVLAIDKGTVAGYLHENRLPGPWFEGEDELWWSELPDGGRVYGSPPPNKNSIGIIEPGNILIGAGETMKTSAQNILSGKVISLRETVNQGTLITEVRGHGRDFHVHVTPHGARELGLIPGLDVSLIFKASSISWI